MKIRDLIDSLKNYSLCSIPEDFEVKGITNHSGSVREDFVFIAVKGSSVDGNSFIRQAVERGSKAVVVQSGYGANFLRGINGKLSFVVVEDIRKAMADLAASFYGNPFSKVRVSGVTGTNGKTTLSYLMEAVLKENLVKPAVIGTINYRFGDKVISAKNTTPGQIQLQSLCADAVSEGITHFIMEVSSHALDQDRTEGIKFSQAIFTNLTQDHLDYHKTMEDYFWAKSKLFTDMESRASAIINIDDFYGRRLKDLVQSQVITYAIENEADVMAKDIQMGIEGTEFCVYTKQCIIPVKTCLIGRHNVYNILAAVAWALEEGIGVECIQSALLNFSTVPGRLQRIDTGSDFHVFLDYAHTEDALKNVLTTLRPFTCGRIISVFGCGGQRDRTKRPKMGKVATELSDYCIITTDNPRMENPKDIIEDIKSGIQKDNYCVIMDRYEAIKKALKEARPKDVVLIAGKGHENYQILKEEVLHFDDKEVVKECIKLLSYARLPVAG